MSPPSPRQPLAEQVWAAMQDYVRVEVRDDELRDALGLGRGAGRVKVLLALADGPRSLGDLAEATGADRPYTTLIVNELEARELVTRTADPQNRRRKLVELTPSGDVALKTAHHIIYRPPPSLTALSEAQLRALSEALAPLDGASADPGRGA